MPIYQIPNRKGLKWGTLTSHTALPASSHKALGAGLDIAIFGMELVENQLLAALALAAHEDVRKALYLYFNIPLQGSKDLLDETLGKIIDVLRTTRKGLEGEFGTLEIVQNEAGTSATLNGYVTRNRLTGSVSPIHMNFPKIMPLQADLGFGGAYWAGLIVHEATHRYVGTTDLVGEVRLADGTTTDGYLGGSTRGDTIATFTADVTGGRTAAEARARVAVSKLDRITTEQHLTNADSYTWLFISMLQGYATTLPVAKKFSGIYADLQEAATKFADVQQEVLAALDPNFAAILHPVTFAPT